MIRLERGGETVVVATPRDVGERDDMNAPVLEWDEQEVEGVLVEPVAAGDVTASNRPDGRQLRYRLHFPKSFGGELEGARVRVRGEWLDVTGAPRRYGRRLTPGAWDMEAEAVATHG